MCIRTNLLNKYLLFFVICYTAMSSAYTNHLWFRFFFIYFILLRFLLHKNAFLRKIKLFMKRIVTWILCVVSFLSYLVYTSHFSLILFLFCNELTFYMFCDFQKKNNNKNKKRKRKTKKYTKSVNPELQVSSPKFLMLYKTFSFFLIFWILVCLSKTIPLKFCFAVKKDLVFI